MDNTRRVRSGVSAIVPVPQDSQKAVPERTSTEHKFFTDSPSASLGDPLGEGCPRVKASDRQNFTRSMETPAMPGVTLLVARSLGELGRGPGEKARAAGGTQWGSRSSCWTGPKSSSGFSATSHGKIRKNFWANPMFISYYGRVLCY